MSARPSDFFTAHDFAKILLFFKRFRAFVDGSGASFTQGLSAKLPVIATVQMI